MCLRSRTLDTARSPRHDPVLLLLPLLLVPGVASIEVSLASETKGFIGEDIELSCKFRSSSPITQRLTVDWSFRPVNGGAKHGILYYHSAAFPAFQGPLKDRVLWNGEVRNGNASIIVKNLTQNDNGTFSCVVQNPPDVSSFVPTTKLTVTKREIWMVLKMGCGTACACDVLLVCRIPTRKMRTSTIFILCQNQLHSLKHYSDRGAPKKRYKDCLKKSLGACHIDHRQWADIASNRASWRLTVRRAATSFEEDRRAHLTDKRQRRKNPTPNPNQPIFPCNRVCLSRIGLFSHKRACS
ncbi:myelin protein zero-like protein 2 isoform X2 [Narcine bancroftii]|uniref:myelin protein zero-like protein 2 isoform X2 n=1 Tax=Narcine bancroftii TaxID=1343680 RepID=UPI0038321C70